MGRYTIEHGYKNGKQKLRKMALFTVAGTIGVSSYLIYSYNPPRSAVELSQPVAAAPVPAVQKLNTKLPWPGYGQAAYGVPDKGVIEASNETPQAVPIASLAKVITALAIVKNKPLASGQEGPQLTLNEDDVALFGEYIRKDGVVVPVEVGEKITQHQAMEAMLMTSANNMADTLARWSFGSIEEYTKYANTMLKELGLNDTNVADASGFSPQTVSTAQDLAQLGALYMKHPVLRKIATQTEASIPVAGSIKNYNASINKNGILGIKVGNTDEAGRCFLVADVRNSNSQEVVSVVAVVGADHLETAMKDAEKILLAGNAGYDEQIAISQ